MAAACYTREMPPRGNGRRLVVDGHELAWWVRRGGSRGCPDCDSLYVIIGDLSRRGSSVHLAMPWPDGPDPAITPSAVAETARQAIAQGWLPGTGHGRFAFAGEPAVARCPRPGHG